MKQKNYVRIAVVISVACLSFGMGIYNRASAKVDTDDVTLANVEAFNTGSSLNCEYIRTMEKCVITVSAGLTVDVLGIGLTKPKADGTLTLDGVVICAANGSEACRPVECSELYTILRK